MYEDFTIKYKINNLPVDEDSFDISKLVHKDIKQKSHYDLSFSILEQVLSDNISRRSLWISDYIDEDIKLAARLYKRGVCLKSKKDDVLYHPYEEYNNSVTLCNVQFRSIDEIKSIISNSGYFTILDKNVEGYFDSDFEGIVVDISEQTKDISCFKKYLSLIEESIVKDYSIKEKTWVLIGGGVLSDTFGLIAYLNKVHFIIIPTTLCSMVDASIGGKVGINFIPYGKNQVGRFYFPDSVIISSEFIQTLSDIDLRCGCIEAVKTALLEHRYDIIDQITDFYSKISKGLKDTLILNQVQEIIYEVVLIKKKFVENDPIENQSRRALNLGHSIAHLLEELALNQGRTIPHGIAVGVGLLVCLKVSFLLSYLTEVNFNFIKDKLINSNLILSFEKLTDFFNKESGSKILIDDIFKSETVKKLLINDKKNTSKDYLQNTVNYVLLSDDSYKIEHVLISLIEEGWKYYVDLKF